MAAPKTLKSKKFARVALRQRFGDGAERGGRGYPHRKADVWSACMEKGSHHSRQSQADAWLDRLRAASDREAALAVVWDLRDDAYDFPEAWTNVTVVRLMHFLADELEHTSDDAIDWGKFGSLLATAVKAARSNIPSNWDG